MCVCVYVCTVKPLLRGHPDERPTPLERPLDNERPPTFLVQKGWPHKRGSTVYKYCVIPCFITYKAYL